MKTATVRDLRNNFARVSRWIQSGEKVKITKRGVPMCLMSPLAKPQIGKNVPKTKKEIREMFRKRFGGEHTEWMQRTHRGMKFKDSIVLTMREEKDW
jgi:antitoxin (DNA-binding transcriptional repressor) of toxin-antitoxin stability system